MAVAVAIQNATFTDELHSASWSSAQIEDMCCLVALVEKFAPESQRSTCRHSVTFVVAGCGISLFCHSSNRCEAWKKFRTLVGPSVSMDRPSPQDVGLSL